eukprot:267862_1
MSYVITCDPGTYASTWCTMGFNAILFISTIPILISFIRHYSKTETKPPTTLFYSSVTFIICSSLALLAQIPVQLFQCIELETPHAEGFILLMFSIFYSVQYYMLLVSLFLRLKETFHGSIYELSECTVKTFKFLFTFNPLFMTITSVILAFNMIIGIALFSILFVIAFGMTTTIVWLYVYKLSKVYKNVDADEHYVDIITKLTILLVFCILGTFIAPIPVTLHFMASPMDAYAFWTVHSMLSLDIYMNFICIVLSYSYFNPYYLKLCGCLDAKVKKKYRRTIKMMNVEVQSTE